MKKLLVLFSLLVLVLTTLSGAACKSGSTTTPAATTAETAAIREYADPATETTLQGFSENNRDKYIQNGNPEFKTAVTQKVFDAAYNQVNPQLGAYQSKEFLSTEEKDGYIRVFYKAKYARAEVRVLMVFDKNHLVAGQFFQ